MHEAATPSGDLAVAAATVVTAKPALLHSLSLSITINASTIVVYDNASAASGTVIARIKLDGTLNANGCKAINFDAPLVANNGITVAVTGTGAVGNVNYSGQ